MVEIAWIQREQWDIPLLANYLDKFYCSKTGNSLSDPIHYANVWVRELMDIAQKDSTSAINLILRGTASSITTISSKFWHNVAIQTNTESFQSVSLFNYLYAFDVALIQSAPIRTTWTDHNLTVWFLNDIFKIEAHRYKVCDDIQIYVLNGYGTERHKLLATYLHFIRIANYFNESITERRISFNPVPRLRLYGIRAHVLTRLRQFPNDVVIYTPKATDNRLSRRPITTDRIASFARCPITEKWFIPTTIHHVRYPMHT